MFENIVAFIRQQFNTEDFIPLHAPVFKGNEKKYVLDTIDSTFVSSVGEYVNRFEKMICDYTNAKYAIAAVNGTTALHLSLLINEVKQGDLIITQPLSFVATCNAISYLKAGPVFIDVDATTLSLSAEKLNLYLKENTCIKSNGCFHKQTGRRIRACVPMHTFGQAAEIDAIEEICKRFNIILIEDAAESLGTIYKGKHTGTFGVCGIYSFNGNKTITCGGGGMIVTNNKQLAATAKHLSTQAKVSHPWDFVHDEVGYNYRLPNINAALACAQMEQIEKLIAAKRKLALAYKNFFYSTPYKYISEQENVRSNYWLNAIVLRNEDERNAFLTYTNSKNVMTRPCWRLMNKLNMFKDAPADNLDNAEWIEKRLVNIPSSPVI
ncbi:MAG TPA: LegC family aminotransferase [Chitinophagaceae bacterium]